jgi:2-polyprenyl-6-methoxyphenol hydroxylase-like FAD-dependent oxidoreductase
MNNMETQVLIIGAGPTGLVLALWLTRMGIRVRIVDKTKGPGTTSRATVFHARNLEFYHQLGIDQKAIAGGIFMQDINLWTKGKKATHFSFGAAGKAISPYPYALIFPQDKQEALLIAELEASGVRVERETELLSYNDGPSGIDVVLSHNGQVSTVHALYLAGCDGAHSTVRKQLQVDFVGGDYAHTFYVADVECEGPVANGELHAALDKADFFIAFPMKGAGNVRLIGTVKDKDVSGGELTWDDVSHDVLSRMAVKVKKLNWFSTYGVHHRVASRFKCGNVFLLGDAGHIHSPVGGQGMNTGIGDAVNLAWKLRDVISGRARVSLLDTYETERIAFGRQLIKSTDRAFTFVTKQSRLADFVRLHIVPRLMPLLFRSAAMRRFFFRTMSQTGIKYPQSALSSGKAGKVKGGDRLPWTGDNFESLSALQWQLHCYGEPRPEIRDWCAQHDIPLTIYPWNPAARQMGLRRNAIYVIRPDGHVGLAQAKANVAEINAYFKRIENG